MLLNASATVRQATFNQTGGQQVGLGVRCRRELADQPGSAAVADLRFRRRAECAFAGRNGGRRLHARPDVADSCGSACDRGPCRCWAWTSPILTQRGRRCDRRAAGRCAVRLRRDAERRPSGAAVARSGSWPGCTASAWLRLLDSRVVAAIARGVRPAGPARRHRQRPDRIVTCIDISTRARKSRSSVCGRRGCRRWWRDAGWRRRSITTRRWGSIRTRRRSGATVAFILAHPARLVFLAVGSPRQEHLAAARGGQRCGHRDRAVHRRQPRCFWPAPSARAPALDATRRAGMGVPAGARSAAAGAALPAGQPAHRAAAAAGAARGARSARAGG